MRKSFKQPSLLQLFQKKEKAKSHPALQEPVVQQLAEPTGVVDIGQSLDVTIVAQAEIHNAIDSGHKEDSGESVSVRSLDNIPDDMLQENNMAPLGPSLQSLV